MRLDVTSTAYNVIRYSSPNRFEQNLSWRFVSKMAEGEIVEPIVVTLDELKKGIAFDVLNRAFGPESLGIILVKGLPEHFHSLRLKVLKSASVLANLPEDELRSLELEESSWLTGWSCGKERLSKTGKPDFNKGSFYVNCAFHKDDDLEGAPKEVVKMYPNFKMYTAPNIWPSEIHNGLEQFKSNIKELCNLIIDVAQLVAATCDNYIQKNYSGYEEGFLQRVVKESTTTKARLLHYYPSTRNEDSSDDDWCGEHLDHSCITGLTSALFIDESKGLTSTLQASPDAQAGLYIRNRRNKIVKVSIPSDHLAFQSGSALEEISESHFKAVPHYVKGTNLPSIARNTLAVFCQPNLNEKCNENETFAQFAQRIIRRNH